MTKLLPFLQIEDILGTQDVHAGRFALWVAIHGVSFPRACLPISEAGHLGSEECTLHYRPYTFRIDLHGQLRTFSLVVL